MKITQSAGGVVLNKAGQVLVVSQHGDSWSLPKGHLDPGETALQAARREIYEETGVRKLDFIRPLGRYERARLSRQGGDDPTELKKIEIFLFKTEENDLKPVDADHPEARWVDKNDVARLLTHAKDKAFYLSILPEL